MSAPAAIDADLFELVVEILADLLAEQAVEDDGVVPLFVSSPDVEMGS